MASLHLYGSSKLPQIVQIFLRLTEYLTLQFRWGYQWPSTPELNASLSGVSAPRRSQKRPPDRRVRVATLTLNWTTKYSRFPHHWDLLHSCLTSPPYLTSSSPMGGRPGPATSYLFFTFFSYFLPPVLTFGSKGISEFIFLGFAWSTASPLIHSRKTII